VQRPGQARIFDVTSADVRRTVSLKVPRVRTAQNGSEQAPLARVRFAGLQRRLDRVGLATYR
jgi:hypothetical protein